MTQSSTRSMTFPVAYDVRLLFAVLFLVGIGLVMVYSASSAVALDKFKSDAFFLKKQALFAGLGIVALVVCSHIPYRLYRVLAYPLMLLGLGLLLAVHIPGLGLSAGGSLRWIKIDWFSFQPMEMARLGLIVYLAYSLSKKQASLSIFSIGLVPHLVILGIFCVALMLQPDFGSVVIFTTLTWLLMFIAGVPLKHLLIVLVPTGVVGVLVMLMADYRLARLLSFLDPWKDPTGAGYQVTQSLIAFGVGGFWGTGIAQGHQKLFYLPEPHTDFVFAVIGEEMGYWGVLFILVLYGTILWRGYKIATTCEDDFGMLTAAGITFALALQVSINMGVCLSLLPPKGLTLPFLSYGGTSLMFNMASIGILTNIGAKNARRARNL